VAALGNYRAPVEPLQGAARLKLSQPRSGRDACATSQGLALTLMWQIWALSSCPDLTRTPK